MDGDGPAKRPPSTRTTVGVLVCMAVVLLVAGLGIARVRNARDTLRRALALTTSTTTPVPAPGAERADGLSPQQQAVVETVKSQVSAIRGLPWKGTLPVTFVSREALAQRVKVLNAEGAAKHRDEVMASESVLKLLQLLPRDLDYVKTLDDLIAGGVLAFYDDETREVFVNGGADPDPATRSALAHELTHALTDQHFDFGARGRALDDAHRTEESAALAAVIEGDATFVAGLWEDKHLSRAERAVAEAGGSNDGGAYAKAPPYLLHSLLFPYQDGLEFVRSRHKAGGFAEVDNAYRNPPTSTEQILHPEAYVAGQGWTPPPLPDLAVATGCGKVDTGTLGEFDMGELLAGRIGESDAHKAASAWNGDAYGVVRCGTALGLADRWQADTAGDAGRLADALTRWAQGWSGASRAPSADGRFSGPKGSGRIVRSGGNRVELILADDGATVDRLARALSTG